MEAVVMRSVLDVVDDDGLTALELAMQMQAHATTVEDHAEADRCIELFVQASS
jgi:hypothetical protein